MRIRRPRRLHVLLATGILLAGAAAVIGKGGPARTALESLGEDPSSIGLSGALWEARTVSDRDGAQNVAYLDASQPLRIRLSGARSATRVTVLVDGVITAKHVVCQAGCRSATSFVTRPPLGAMPGQRTISVRTELVRRGNPASVTFDVQRGVPVPRSLEIEPTAQPGAGSGGLVTGGDAARVRRSLRPFTRLVAPHARVQVTAASSLAALIELQPPPGPLTIDLPVRSGATARLSTPRLTDLLVERPRGKGIVSAEPGPRTATTRWGGEETSKRQATAATRTQFVRLSDRGPSFATYDGELGFSARGRDWPVSLVFHGAASVSNVKAGLRRAGLTRSGESRFLAYRTNGTLRFDADKGLKTACDGSGTDLHVRVYAPPASDRFRDPAWGQVVIATAHFDRADGCGQPPKAFGYSELAERTLSRILRSKLGWVVRPGALDLANREPLRRDRSDSTHVWLSDGRATAIRVP